MQYFKLLVLTLFALAFPALAADDVQKIIQGSDTQKSYIEKLNKSGILEQFKEAEQSDQFEQYKEVANDISDNSLSNLAVSLTRYAGVDEGQAGLFSGQVGTNTSPETLTGIFVSFSMTSHELREAFKEAEEQGAELYFIGMHPQDTTIGDTMRRLQELLSNTGSNANARFHPKAFEEFNITSVPAILHAKKGSVGLIHGLMNIDYLKRTMQGTTGFNDFGFLGPTRNIIERNLLEEIEDRLSRIDGDALKKKAVDNFWNKRQFTRVPAASKTEEFYINPTVKVTKDIVNPNGDVLARAGDILNPLDAMPNNNTYILFNARDLNQLQWVDHHLKANQYTGIVMLMTSELDKDDGWNHLSALRKHFSRELYLVPQELVDRFSISGLPAVVTTDNQKKLLRINQYSLKEESE